MLNKKLILIGLFMVVFSMSTYGYFYNITYTCQNDVCIEREIATWHIEVSNVAGGNVEFTAIELEDVKNFSVFAEERRDYYPQNDFKGDLIKVITNRKVQVNLTAPIPEANFNDMFYFRPCFTRTVEDNFLVARDNIYEYRQCFNQNETMEVTGCVMDNNCYSNEYCFFNECVKLECAACQYVGNHTCVDHECCSNEACSLTKECRNNTCVDIGCEYNQYAFNHTCITLNCADDEHIVDRSCQKLTCGFFEHATNHSCQILECRKDQYISNHTCVPLNCKRDEYAEDHVCKPLNCLYNETVFNHKCVPLECSFYQDEVNHECLNNKALIFKLILEFIAIIIIILFFILDYRAYEHDHEEKLLHKPNI